MIHLRRTRHSSLQSRVLSMKMLKIAHSVYLFFTYFVVVLRYKSEMAEMLRVSLTHSVRVASETTTV